MNESTIKSFESEGGEFVSPPSVFIEKLRKVRAVLFDWDGVFNDGFKRGDEGSLFSEVDAMGTNMLRFALWKSSGQLPVVAIITGEANPYAVSLAKREHFHEVFQKSKNKSAVFDSLCKSMKLNPEEVLFFFDDVLDLEVARNCGARIMIGRSASHSLTDFARRNGCVDYVTANDGGSHGLREGCEVVISLLGMFDEVIKNRMTFSSEYQSYLAEKQKIDTKVVEAN